MPHKLLNSGFTDPKHAEPLRLLRAVKAKDNGLVLEAA